MGSGPLRARARVERELFEKLGYAEDAARGVLVLETRTLPTDDVAAWVAAKAGLQPDGLTFAVAPTASLAGGVQIVARVVETGLHKMDTLGFDVRRVVSAIGTAPLPPTAKNDLRAIGRTNDCVLYGGQARYVVRADDDELAELAERLPASASRDYGTPFYEIFKRYDNDFYKIDPLLFSPAEVWLTSATSGRTSTPGTLEPGACCARRCSASEASMHDRRSFSARTGWHTDELCRALAARGHVGRGAAVRRRCWRASAGTGGSPDDAARSEGVLAVRGRRRAGAHHSERLARADHLPRGRAALDRGARHAGDELAAGDRARGGQVLHLGAAARGRAADARDRGLRARRRRAWPRCARWATR